MKYHRLTAIRYMNCIFIRDLWGFGIFNNKQYTTGHVRMVTGPVLVDRYNNGDRLTIRTRRHHSYVQVNRSNSINGFAMWRFICPKCLEDTAQTLFMTFPIDEEPRYNWLCRRCLKLTVDPHKNKSHHSFWWMSQALKVKHGGMPGIGHPWPMQPRYPWWQKTFQNDMERGMLLELESWKLLGESIAKSKKRCTS